MSIVSSLFCYRMRGEFDTNFVYHPNRFTCVRSISILVIKDIIWIEHLFVFSSLPWNQETLFGYFSEICISMICIEAYLIDNGELLLLFISMCLHHQAFHRMFQNSLKKLDRINKNRNNEEYICGLIRFHISVKE